MSQAQVWTARWHPTLSYDDEGQVIAVGRSGATYVAGKSKRYGDSAGLGPGRRVHVPSPPEERGKS